MEPERDGVVRNNGPPIIGILKYYALAAAAPASSSSSIRRVAGACAVISDWNHGGDGGARRPFLLHAASQAARRAFISRGAICMSANLLQRRDGEKWAEGAKRGHIELSTEDPISANGGLINQCEKSTRV